MTERHEMFDEMLDECYEPWTIAGMTYYPSQILFECDPIAYRVTLSDWQSMQCQDGLHSHEIGGSVCDFCGEDAPQESCACLCGCEVPLSAGMCVDCSDGTHQNNNDLPQFRSKLWVV
jgi:hypothetical protein